MAERASRSDNCGAIERVDGMGKGRSRNGIRGRDQGRFRFGFIVKVKDRRRGEGGIVPRAGAGTWVKKRATGQGRQQGQG